MGKWLRTHLYPRPYDSYVWVVYNVASIYRPRLSETTFIGITGSAGKTTAKDYAVAILSKVEPTTSNFMTHNSPEGASLAILKARPSDRVLVQEVGVGYGGGIARIARLLRPSICAVTNIGDDHYRDYRSREAIAREKRVLVEMLPSDGVAVLNADDPLVWAMAEHSPAPVLSFGEAKDADLRVTEITGAWPDPLAMTVTYGGQAARVETRLIGRHWTTAVLAAIGIGLARGVPLELSAEAIAEVEPDVNRMNSLTAPSGVTFLLDAFKAPYWSVDLAFDVMRLATPRRKIIVLGTVSDMPGDTKSKYRRLIRDALAIADLVVFTGPLSTTVLRGLTDKDRRRLHIFDSVRAASGFLNSNLRDGDLVLLKGSAAADHLERIYLDHLGQIACWRDHCGRKKPCMTCLRQHRAFLPKVSKPRAAWDAAYAAANLQAGSRQRGSSAKVEPVSS